MAKAVAKKCTLSVTALLALGICVGSPFHANECSAKENAKPAGCVSPRLSIQHEMVPHVVLPETIQYNKVARSNQTLPGISTAGDYGMVSPFVIVSSVSLL